MSGGTATNREDLRARPLLRSLLNPLRALNPGVDELYSPRGNSTALPRNFQLRSESRRWEKGEIRFVQDSGSAETSFNLPQVVVIGTGASSGATIAGLHYDPESQLVGQLRRSIHTLLDVGADEHFENGMDSNLRVGLVALVTRFPTQALDAIREELRTVASLAVLAEVLRTLGAIDEQTSKDDRLSFVAGYLSHTSSLIRDAAATALSYLEDSRALQFLRDAIRRERNASLRADMLSVAADLERDGTRTA